MGLAQHLRGARETLLNRVTLFSQDFKAVCFWYIYVVPFKIVVWFCQLILKFFYRIVLKSLTRDERVLQKNDVIVIMRRSH